VGIFQIFTIWPFPYEELAKVSHHIKKFIVAEMNLGQIAHEVSCATRCDVIKVNRVDGGLITPDEILERIKHVSV
jgi:2-oxoglutarate ferredoxin oxidoreductase subunit alpha